MKSFARTKAYYDGRFLGSLAALLRQTVLPELSCTQPSAIHLIFIFLKLIICLNEPTQFIMVYSYFHFVFFTHLLFVCLARRSSAYFIRFVQKMMVGSCFFCWHSWLILVVSMTSLAGHSAWSASSLHALGPQCGFHLGKRSCS